MSYPPLQGAPPAHGGPSMGQYPPQGYPPQPPYGQAQGYPPQQPYGQIQGYPTQQYPPPQQSYGGNHALQQSYGGPPPQYGAFYQAPLDQPQQPYGAPQQQYAGQQFAPTVPTPPSPGYGPNTLPVNDAAAAAAADVLRKAMKGLGADKITIIHTLCHYPAPLIPHLKSTYEQRIHRNLEADIASETSHHFKSALLSILRGPLQQDVFLLNKALAGLGTSETLLNDILLARSNADLHAIKQAYHATYHRPLDAAVASDLSGKTARLFSMILSGTRAEESAPVLPAAVDADVAALHRATEARLGTDELTVCSILSSRSDGQLRAIALAYEATFRIPLEKVLEKEFSGHMKAALVQMVRAACDRAMRDAVALGECMAGMGTKDELLVARVVRCHWERDHMGQVRGAYKVRYGKELAQRIRGETSGDYQRLLLAMVE